MDERQKENLNPFITFRRECYDLFMARSVTILPMNFEESKILLVYELYSFELIKFSLKALRQETPSTYLNNIYRTTESALQNRNSQKGLLATLECENKYQKTSLRQRGTQPISVLLKHDLIPPNVHQLIRIASQSF